MVISWCRGPRLSRPSPGERSRAELLDMESLIQLRDRSRRGPAAGGASTVLLELNSQAVALRCCFGMSRFSGLVELVRLMILRGEVPAGGRMLELLLAERFRTSRTLVREALRQLEGDGLLIANADGGMRVVELSEHDLIAALQVRAALEELSAGLAAEQLQGGRVPADSLSRLSELADAAHAAARTGAVEAAVLADRHFHRALDALAGNEPCHDALVRIWDRIVVASLQPATRVRPPASADRDHRELVVAVAAGDAKAASAIARRHALASLNGRIEAHSTRSSCPG
jgi:DNA-binding GntR family transcriptional regulator